MGDKLATGWADKKAKSGDVIWDPIMDCMVMVSKRIPFGAPSLRPTDAFLDAEQRRLLREYLAEEIAEEATLP